MGIVVDLIIVAVVLLFVFMGYKKGLTGSLLKLLSFILAIIIAVILYKPVSKAIVNNTMLDENIRETITNVFGEGNSNESEEEQKMPSSMFEEINDNIKEATEDAKLKIIEETSNTIINITSGLIVFIIARIILAIVSLFLNQITQLPILKQIDRIGGIGYGAIEGIFIVHVVLGIISLTSMLWADNVVLTAVTKSAVGNMLYNNNLILKILFK